MATAKTVNPDVVTLSDGKVLDLTDRQAVLLTFVGGSKTDVVLVLTHWKGQYETAKAAFDSTPLAKDYETARNEVLAAFAKTDIAKQFLAAETARDESKRMHDETVRILKSTLRTDCSDLDTIEQRGRKA